MCFLSLLSGPFNQTHPRIILKIRLGGEVSELFIHFLAIDLVNRFDAVKWQIILY